MILAVRRISMNRGTSGAVNPKYELRPVGQE